MWSPRRIAAWTAGQPYLLLSIGVLGWAGNIVASRLAVGQVSPMAIVALRWFVVMVVLLLLAHRPLAAEWRLLQPRWPYLFAMGALGYTAFNALFYWAAHHTSAVNLGVLQGVTPGFVMLAGFLAYRTPIRPVQLLGLLATMAGIVVTVSRGDLDVLRTFALNIGDLGVVTASMLYAGYTVGLRRRPPVQPLTFFAAMAFSALLTSTPLLAWELAAGAVIWPGLVGWGLILFIALWPSLLSQLCFMRGVELIGPSRAGLFMNLVPVIAPVLAVVILAETFALYHAVALALVLGGIWLGQQQAERDRTKDFA